MKKFAFLVLVFITAITYAQDNGSISGKILDLELDNEPMLFANVHLKGDTKTTLTNFHGNFEFKNISTGEHTLIVSYAGYEKLEIPVLVKKDKVSQVKGGLSQIRIFVDDLAINQTNKKVYAPASGLR